MPPIKTRKDFSNKFALTPLPYYKDITRPLKSMESGEEGYIQAFTPDMTKKYIKEDFIKCVHYALSSAGITDDTGGIMEGLLTTCAVDGLYKTPDPMLLEGIRIGWYAKPTAPLVSAAFEQSQLDFQNEILRMIRDSEDRMTRMLKTQQGSITALAAGSSKVVPKFDVLARLKKKSYKVLIWVICYCYNMGTVQEITLSDDWNTAIDFWIAKGWDQWGLDIVNKYTSDRSIIDKIADKTRKNFTSTPPFKDKTVLCPPQSAKPHYKTEKELSDDVVAMARYLETLEKSKQT